MRISSTTQTTGAGAPWKMRHLAQEMDDPESKRIVLSLAKEYDTLAKRAEARSAGSPKAAPA
jgi:hypothetical protein